VKLSRFFISLFIFIALVAGYFLVKEESQEIAPKKSESKTTVFVDSSQPAAALATPSPTVAATQVVLTPREKEQLQILAQIFKSKNDNDPRMDQDLKNLSEPLKSALRNLYSETKMENRNERGTIAFLIGRELSEGRGSASDIDFLKNVLLEKPCMNLMDCSKPAASVTAEEQHLEGIHETTAHYPQLMDLRYLKQSLNGGNLSSENRAAVIAALEAARNSPNPRVAQEAQAILDSMSK